MAHEHPSPYSCPVDVQWTPLTLQHSCSMDVPWTPLTIQLSYRRPMNTPHHTAVLWMSSEHPSPYNTAVSWMSHEHPSPYSCPMDVPWTLLTIHYTAVLWMSNEHPSPYDTTAVSTLHWPETWCFAQFSVSCQRPPAGHAVSSTPLLCTPPPIQGCRRSVGQGLWSPPPVGQMSSKILLVVNSHCKVCINPCSANGLGHMELMSNYIQSKWSFWSNGSSCFPALVSISTSVTTNSPMVCAVRFTSYGQTIVTSARMKHTHTHTHSGK